VTLGLFSLACGGDDGAAPVSPPTAIARAAAAVSAPTAIASSAGEATATATKTTVAKVQEYAVPSGSGPHDVAPAADGGVWYTAQRSGKLGWLDPKTGKTEEIDLGRASGPHGVIVGPDGAAWVTVMGRNTIVRVDPKTHAVTSYALPAGLPAAGVHTAVFDTAGKLWFTGNNGYYGRLDPSTGKVELWPAPGGAGPYGITATPDGHIYYASLQGSHIAAIDPATGAATRIDPPTRGQGARRIWSDSKGRLWVSEWIAGQLALYDPATKAWKEWKLPGSRPMAYAVYVDDHDMVWLSDFGGGGAVVRFDPATEEFTTFELPSAHGDVRQILGRPGEIWAAESASDRLVVIRAE
jgi:virginiamycin B lyase